MSPQPYCLPCNRHHVPGSTDRCAAERLGALLGLVLLTLAMVIVGLALGALSVGAW
ncbi:hypothetical protein PBI_KESHU_52 [Mycobacterium phage Keshu]|uniref:Uncharacterized protein n=1 Tax=Mycobacterium phage Keshu TaxID=1567471 RepID=A0A0B4ZXZ5_9CAUD|nr:hypothetical protein PBI_KESHU_52 [Mycobacterium phage Keshu]AJD82272.1 hypothetical protein PBI_KESHU_52 [Mycobacterium phage Keshu]